MGALLGNVYISQFRISLKSPKPLWSWDLNEIPSVENQSLYFSGSGDTKLNEFHFKYLLFRHDGFRRNTALQPKRKFNNLPLKIYLDCLVHILNGREVQTHDFWMSLANLGSKQHHSWDNAKAARSSFISCSIKNKSPSSALCIWLCLD